MLWVCTTVVFGVIAVIWWVWKRFTDDLISMMQGLVDKMKEYDLDARAGLMICRGHDLKIYYMDANLQKMLGAATCVNDILPESTREKHRQLVARYVGAQPLPDSLNHPLRNVLVLNKDNALIQTKLIIGKMCERKGLLSNFFYVILQANDGLAARPSRHGHFAFRHSSSSSFRKTLQSSNFDQENETFTHEWTTSTSLETSTLNEESVHFESVDTQGALNIAEVHGLGAASYIEHDLVPATESYAQATVLYMDIVDFTCQCMSTRSATG